MKNLQKNDPQIYNLIKKEEKRQKEGLELIPSENYTSRAVMEAMGSILTNKYSEGYPRKRYYGGNEFIDDIELVAQERAKKLFGVVSVNVQPYSGSPANLAVYLATIKPGDTFMGQALTNECVSKWTVPLLAAPQPEGCGLKPHRSRCGTTCPFTNDSLSICTVLRPVQKNDTPY